MLEDRKWYMWLKSQIMNGSDLRDKLHRFQTAKETGVGLSACWSTDNTTTCMQSRTGSYGISCLPWFAFVLALVIFSLSSFFFWKENVYSFFLPMYNESLKWLLIFQGSLLGPKSRRGSGFRLFDNTGTTETVDFWKLVYFVFQDRHSPLGCVGRTLGLKYAELSSGICFG